MSAAPKQTAAEAARELLMPAYGVPVNVGDLVARLGDGNVCPAGHWPRTEDPHADRRAFAAAFLGVSDTFHDPRNASAAMRRLTVLKGGPWEFDGAGKLTKDGPVGPAIVDGRMSSQAVESCEPDEAVGKAADAVAGGRVGVALTAPGV